MKINNVMKADKYIIRRIKMFYRDGTRSVVKTRKEVYNLQSYREYLMVKNGASRVEFTYDTIPAEKQGNIRLVIQGKSTLQ